MTRRRRSIVAITGGLLFVAGLMLVGCGGGSGGGDASAQIGDVSGLVREASTQTPIAGASVTIGGKSATSGADGTFAITGIAVGSQSASVTKTGYQPYSGTVVISAGANVCNFTLSPTVVAPTITVTQPNGAEAWSAGGTQSITWQSAGVIDHAHLQYSPNDGTTWRDIVANTPNNGAYSWAVPQVITSKALVKAIGESAANAALSADSSNSVFSIGVPTGGRYLYVRSDAEGAPGAVTVPIYITDATGVAGGDIQFTFDASVLTATGATATTLTQGFGVVSNPTPGAIVISFASAQGISGGSGALINVQFTVASGAAGRTSALTLASATLYSETAQTIAHNKLGGLFTAR